MYEWLKALHIIAVISWMAGIFYLPRLFAYHADAPAGSQLSETFKVMERRLLRIIMNPAMIAVWVFGLWMAYEQNWWTQGWFIAKMVLVTAMTVFHHALVRWRAAFERDENTHSARFFRIANEVPTLLMIAIVIIVIVKPF